MRKLFAFIPVLSALLASAGTAAWGQTDVAVSAYGAFNGSTNGNGTTQSLSDQAGFLIEARYIRNPLVGYELTYSFNRANEAYMSSIEPPCPAGGTTPCGPTKTWAAVPANAHEISGDWVASLRLGAFRPFALAGAGAFVSVPASGTVMTTTQVCGTVNNLCSQTTATSSTSIQTTAVFVYGAGVDWTLLPHLGIRVQYRGNVYKAPELAQAFRSTGSFTQSAQPVAGIFFRF